MPPPALHRRPPRRRCSCSTRRARAKRSRPSASARSCLPLKRSIPSAWYSSWAPFACPLALLPSCPLVLLSSCPRVRFAVPSSLLPPASSVSLFAAPFAPPFASFHRLPSRFLPLLLPLLPILDKFFGLAATDVDCPSRSAPRHARGNRGVSRATCGDTRVTLLGQVLILRIPHHTRR